VSDLPNRRQSSLCASRLAWSGLVGALALMSVFWPRACGAHEVRAEPQVKVELEPRLLPLDGRLGWSSQIPSPGPDWYFRVLRGTPRTDASDGAERRSRSFRRRAAWASGAVAIAGGLIARWSKKKADRAYDRYLHSAAVRRQDRAFERSQRYDRITGGAFVVMEAGVVLAACFTFY